MINKLLLNNQIIANKKKINQAKINTISKIVHKIRKLKEMIDKKPETSKNNIKLRKTTEILKSLKIMKPSEIVRKGLVNEKNPFTIITNSNSTPDEVAAAMIWSHKNLIEFLRSLKTLMNIDCNNPTWKDEVLQVSKRKQKFLKVEVKKQKRQERKGKNALTLKREEWLVNNTKANPEFEKDIETKGSISKQGEWLVENVSGGILMGVKENSMSSKIGNITTTKIKTKPIHKINDHISQESILTTKNHLDENEKVKPVKMAVDPFFLTESGENYISTVVIERTQPEVQNNGVARKDRRAYLHKEKHFTRNQNGHQFLRNKESSKSTKHFKYLNKSETENNYQEVESSGTLHPSWAAKQKLQTIHEFFGTKIKFDDEVNVVTQPNKNNSEKNLNHDKNDFLTLENKKTILHPSWVAKQKLKPSITVFQGKKVIFDD